MKRELKFRAFQDDKMIVQEGYGVQFQLEFLKKVYYDNIDIMQFTGLKDKKGIEIYESDVLKEHGIVAWNDIELKWSVIDLNWNDKREWHDMDYLTSEFEIIGNIHQDKHLIE